MGMILDPGRTVDPRDNLARASRDELWDFAKANGVTFEVGQAVATKSYMEGKLRALGLVHIKPAVRFAGRPTGQYYGDQVITESPKVTEIDADKDMLRQMKEQAAQPNDRPPLHKAVAEMRMNELRADCKRLGIKMDRRDNMNTLREKLRGQDAA